MDTIGPTHLPHDLLDSHAGVHDYVGTQAMDRGCDDQGRSE